MRKLSTKKKKEKWNNSSSRQKKVYSVFGFLVKEKKREKRRKNFDLNFLFLFFVSHRLK